LILWRIARDISRHFVIIGAKCISMCRVYMISTFKNKLINSYMTQIHVNVLKAALWSK